MLKLLFALVIIVTTASQSWAHEGHGSPGSLPPPPHGGKLKEAKGAAGQSELFIEAVLQGLQLTLYPLTLNTKDTSAFVALSTIQDIKNIEVRVEYPRQKTILNLTPKLADTSFEVVLPKEKKGRIVIEVTATYGGNKKTAKVQFE